MYFSPEALPDIQSIQAFQWIPPSMPFMALVPVHKTFAGKLFDRLRYRNDIFPISVNNSQWRLAPHVVEEWKSLEHLLRTVLLALLELASPPLSPLFRLWAWPCRYGYEGHYSSYNKGHLAVKRSRDAFLPLMAATTLALMCIHEKAKRVGKEYAWRDKLLQKIDLHPGWLAELEASFVGDFTIPRVGGIVSVQDWSSLDLIPYLHHASMPLCISWGILDTLEILPSWPPWAPSFHTISLLRRTPSAPSPLPSAPAPPQVERYSGQRIGESWQDFFVRRDVVNKKKAEVETPATTQIRLDREAHAAKMVVPGKKGATVWIWEKVGSWRIRRSAGRRHYEDIWEVYGAGQKRYDSFHNCWDICTEFDPEDLDNLYNDDDFDFVDGPTGELPSQSIPTSDIQIFSCADLQRLNPETTSQPLPMSFKMTLEQVAYDRYGFTNNDIGGTPERWEVVRKVLGNGCWLQEDGFSEDTPSSAVKERLEIFFKYLCHSSSPTESHDILDDASDVTNRSSWNFTISKISLLETPYYLLRERMAGASDMHLAVTSPATILQIVRSGWGPRLEDVAHELLLQCIHFQTLLPVPLSTTTSNISMSVPPNTKGTITLGYRSVGYKPDPLDRRAYEAARSQFLTSPRGRAAILAGGLIARLARDLVDPEEVIHGSVQNTPPDTFHLNYSEPDGPSYWDDRLSESEIDLICGVYYVDSGQAHPREGVQTAHMSWWPKLLAFSHATFNLGFWSKDCEKWYQRRLRELSSGRAKLHTASEWKVMLRMTNVIPKAVKTNERLSGEFLDKFIG